MTEALGAGGTSFDALYVNVNGESGYFDRSLAAYGREGRPVPALRHADPPGRVHEPVVVLLPALPAPPPPRPLVAPPAPVPRLTRAFRYAPLASRCQNGLLRLIR